ncbi:MAG: serine hydrolase domain-containing protein [Burkholderiales bacterium]
MTIRLIQRGAALALLCIFASAVWAQDFPSAKPEEVGMSSQRLERLDTAFKREVDQGRLPGAVMMVLRRGRLVYSASMGVQEPGKPMTRDAIFRLYSMTKPWVSVAAIMLMEQGALQLSDPVSKFLPAMKAMQVSVAKIDPALAKVSYTQVAAEREMTVQDLLRHTTGLVYGELSVNAPVKEAYTKAGFYSPEGSFDLRAMTPAEQVERLSKAPLAQQPGTTWEYGLASDVLGRVVEVASGKRLAEFLDERMFKPLKMTDSGFSVPQDKLSRVAQPFEKDPATGTPNRLIDVSRVPGNDSGGAGGVGTAADYMRFCQMLLNGGQLNGVRILSRTSVALMTSDHLGTKIQSPLTPGELLFGVQGYTFGLGFAVRQGAGVAQVPGSAGEYMWAGFAGTYFYVDPKEELIGIYMSQAPGATRQYYRRLFKQLVSQAITD